MGHGGSGDEVGMVWAVAGVEAEWTWCGQERGGDGNLGGSGVGMVCSMAGAEVGVGMTGQVSQDHGAGTHDS